MEDKEIGARREGPTFGYIVAVADKSTGVRCTVWDLYIALMDLAIVGLEKLLRIRACHDMLYEATHRVQLGFVKLNLWRLASLLLLLGRLAIATASAGYSPFEPTIFGSLRYAWHADYNLEASFFRPSLWRRIGRVWRAASCQAELACKLIVSHFGFVIAIDLPTAH